MGLPASVGLDFIQRTTWKLLIQRWDAGEHSGSGCPSSLFPICDQQDGLPAAPC